MCRILSLRALQVTPPSNTTSSHQAATLEPQLTPRHPSGSCCCCGNNNGSIAAAHGSLTAHTPLLQQQLQQSQQHVCPNAMEEPNQQQQQQDELEDCGEGAVVTTQRLRAAVAPETVLQVSATPLEQVAVELREVTQKMALLRLASTAEGVRMSGAMRGNLCICSFGEQMLCWCNTDFSLCTQL
jgi:hypothetical protein